MPEPIVVTPEQVTTPEVKEIPEQDLITRVSQVKAPEQVKKELDDKFNINDLDATIEKLPDPAVKEQVLGLKKSLLKGENQKYQEIANLRKQYESELAKANSWTPEKVQGLLNNPDFVNAAQSVVTPQQENTSMLSVQEKQLLEENNKKVNTLLQQNLQLQRVQQDNQLKTRYANYQPEVVDNVFNELYTGKLQATREDLWKVIDYENAVRRAYELGQQDKNQQNQERVQGMTLATGMNMSQPQSIEKQKGETIQNFLLRSYAEHAKKK